MQSAHPDMFEPTAKLPSPVNTSVIAPAHYDIKTTAKRGEIHENTAETSYLFGSSGVLDRPAWSDSSAGRLWIRFISRGLVGAAAFTLGGHYANIKMRNYEPELYGELNWANLRNKNILQTVARLFDAGPAKILHATVGNDTITRFHSREAYHSLAYGNPYTDQQLGYLAQSGRSLGAEIVQVTFNFFSASIGDATVRNLIQAVDPNVEQPWIVDDRGHATVRGRGHFDLGKWATSLLRSSWRIVSKNGGEDWAAALPYVYQMKWQRQAINNIGNKPGSWTYDHGLRGGGFKRASDANINGALAKVDSMGNAMNGHEWAGALDLHTRFVGYNWYTLMYREGYDALGRMLKNWKNDGFAIHAPHIENPVADAYHFAVHSFRYVTKSFIKANLYMQPAVIPFWMMRVPQTTWRGRYEMQVPGTGINGIKAEYDYLRTASGEHYPRAKLIHDNNFPPRAFINGQEVFTHQSTDPNFIKNIANPHDFNIRRNPFDAVLNIFGAASYHSGSALTRAVDGIFGAPRASGLTDCLMRNTPDAGNLALGREKMIRSFVDASFSYYPYMYAKAETALRVDDRKNSEALGKMDKEIYGFMDNIGQLRAHDTWQSVKNIWHLALHEEKSMVSREGNHHLLVKAQQQPAVGDGTTIPLEGNKTAAHPHTPANENETESPPAIAADHAAHRASAPPTVIQLRDAKRVGTAISTAATYIPAKDHAANDHGPVAKHGWAQHMQQQSKADDGPPLQLAHS